MTQTLKMKRCKQGQYYCYKDKKCKRIPTGYRVGLGGWLRKENGEEQEDTKKNGNHSNGNGNGNGNSNGSSDGGGFSEGWSQKYKRSIDCNNPKGFSQRAHCQGRKKMSEEKKDHEYSMARSELKTVTNAAKRLQKKMGKKGEGNLQAWVQSKITKAADYIDTAADYVTNEETVKEEGLRDWFGKSKSKDGKSGWVNVVTGGTCASDEPGEGTPKCVSSAKRTSMSKAERLSAQRRKKAADPGQQQKSGAAKPTYVSTDPKKKMKKEEVEVTEAKDKPGKGSGKKDACYHKVKSRYSVWPSAYASGALVKCRKVGADNWGNKSESYEFSNWRDDFQATEYEFVDLIKPEPLKGEQIDEGQKCWKGYEKKGTKKMFGKTYNNCVKKEGYAPGDVDQKVGAVTPISKDEREAAKQRLLAKAKAKREKMKEEKEESNIGGGNLQKLSKKATKRIDYDVDGDVDPNDKVEKKTGEYGEELPTPFGKFRTGDSKKVKVKKEEFSDWRAELDEDWQKVNKSDKTDGMSPAAVKAYRRENPGSKLKTAVTGDPKPGSKDAKRRKSFCARSKGQQDMHNIDCSKTPDKPVCKARRRWKC